jgi:hypothetical protein
VHSDTPVPSVSRSITRIEGRVVTAGLVADIEVRAGRDLLGRAQHREAFEVLDHHGHTVEVEPTKNCILDVSKTERITGTWADLEPTVQQLRVDVSEPGPHLRVEVLIRRIRPQDLIFVEGVSTGELFVDSSANYRDAPSCRRSTFAASRVAVIPCAGSSRAEQSGATRSFAPGRMAFLAACAVLLMAGLAYVTRMPPATGLSLASAWITLGVIGGIVGSLFWTGHPHVHPDAIRWAWIPQFQNARPTDRARAQAPRTAWLFAAALVLIHVVVPTGDHLSAAFRLAPAPQPDWATPLGALLLHALAQLALWLPARRDAQASIVARTLLAAAAEPTASWRALVCHYEAEHAPKRRVEVAPYSTGSGRSVTSWHASTETQDLPHELRVTTPDGQHWTVDPSGATWATAWHAYDELELDTPRHDGPMVSAAAPPQYAWSFHAAQRGVVLVGARWAGTTQLTATGPESLVLYFGASPLAELRRALSRRRAARVLGVGLSVLGLAWVAAAILS